MRVLPSSPVAWSPGHGPLECFYFVRCLHGEGVFVECSTPVYCLARPVRSAWWERGPDAASGARCRARCGCDGSEAERRTAPLASMKEEEEVTTKQQTMDGTPLSTPLLHLLLC